LAAALVVAVAGREPERGEEQRECDSLLKTARSRWTTGLRRPASRFEPDVGLSSTVD
jgi:hypothetical protein